MLFASASSGAQLTCHPPNFTCLDSPVSCECQGEITLAWIVGLTSAAPDPLFAEVFVSSDSEGSETSRNGFTAVLCNVTQEPIHGIIVTRFSSKLNFMLMESVTVECDDNQPGSATVLLQNASKLHE